MHLLTVLRIYILVYFLIIINIFFIYIFFFLGRGLRSVGQADQAVAVLRQALKAGVKGIDEQAS